MARTPNPTIEEYRGMAAAVGGRVSIALEHIKLRLSENLPALIDDTNLREGYTTPDVQIRKPEFYAGAPVGGKKNQYNGLLIGASREFEFVGNRHVKSSVQVSVYSIDQRVDKETQYLRHNDRIDLIYRALYPFLGGCVDDEDRVCWKQLIPISSGWENEAWEIYGGTYAYFRMTFDPSQNGWK